MANTLRFKRGLVATIPTAAAGEPLFTTDTFDLYIGNGTTNTRFQKYIASGTTSQLLRGDGSLLTMPIVLTSPSSGQVLKYNGTSWVNDSDAGITGSGTTNYLPKFTGASTLGNSNVQDNGTTVQIGSASTSGIGLTIRNGGGASKTAYVTLVGTNSSSTDATWYSGVNVFATDASFEIKNAAGNGLLLNPSGNLGLGVVPSAWASNFKVVQVNSSVIVNNAVGDSFIGVNYYNDGNNRYINTDFAVSYGQQEGSHRWYIAPSGTAGAIATFTQPMTLTANGRLLLGTTSEGTYLLDVNGTGRFIGQLTSDTFISSRTSLYLLRDNTASGYGIFKNSTTEIGIAANGSVALNIASTGAATFSSSVTAGTNVTLDNGILYVSAGSGTGYSSRLSTAYSFPYVDTYLDSYAGASWEGRLNFRTNSGGGAMTTQLSIANSGAATFSSSVAATSGVFSSVVNVNGASTLEQLNVLGNIACTGTANRYIRLQSATNYFYNLQSVGDDFHIVEAGATPRLVIRYPNGNVGIGNTTPDYKLDVTGEARVSSAIAIGTTPDTNKPFKILKNINTTVGINFENTSTSSLAFSAIQMGTDVTGGTKFTNLVYASSGVTANGVYNPDGTSLINNGAGGLNFLGNPIRMYTGGSNGSLRWDMTNDGFITQYSGTNPSTNATDGYRQYSADVTAGNAAPHFRTENGAIIKLYQETTGVGNSIISLGGGNAVLDDTTFDGYTLRQIVKALRNQGILA